MFNKLYLILGSFFGVGYFPVAPGTTASIFGFIIYFMLRGNFPAYGLVFLIITVVGFTVAGQVEKIFNKKDPSCVVIDEVSGAMIAVFMLPVTPSIMITAFFLFRAFDMFKIYPMNKLEEMHGGVGIMMDDVVAGLYANLTMQAALYLKTNYLF